MDCLAVREIDPLSDDVWLKAAGLSIHYEDAATPAVSQVAFELRAGESVLLLGPSGCGKSTLAMLCAGLIPGMVDAVVSGDWFRHPRLQRPGGVGYVFQDADAQFCMLTAADEIAFGLENLQTPRQQMDDRMVAALERADLAGLSLAAHHAQLSGGMKQKLAMACALAMNADLLVFDEPTANLDPLATRLVFDQIASLHARRQTMLVIEHKFDRLLEHMDKVVLFDATGRVVRVGPTAEVMREEWDWLKAQGVVAPWKEPPAGLRRGGGVARALATLEPALAIVPAPTAGATVGERDDAVVVLRDVSAGYGQQRVLAHVNVTVPLGSITAIVGPNGAGKSTLLQLLAGLLKPQAGRVEILGEPIARRNRRRLLVKVSYSFQNPEFQFVFERVGDELANRVINGPVPDDVQSLLRQFGLDAVAGHSPYAVSQGQKRRLSVAAMLREAHDLYCLDEPTFGQDARTQQTIMTELARLHEDGRTIVLTTHDMDLVRRYATHVLVVAEGGILYAGAPSALFANADILRRAHLLADQWEPPTADAAPSLGNGLLSQLDSEATDTADGLAPQQPSLHSRAGSPLARLNPAWHLLAVFACVLLTIFATHVTQAAAMCLLPILLMLGLGRISPLRLARRYAAFVLFYLFYLFTYMAYSKIPPGTVQVVHILWLHADWYGFRLGLILALRMLGAVGFGIMFLSSTDLTAFAAALSQSLRIPPKFSYGLFAGVHFLPLFRGEWEKLRLARRLRGREGRVWVRPVRYAIPILSQAIRMSERVAIAMEARGFVGVAAGRADGRSYYRIARTRALDVLFSLGLPLLVFALLWSLR